MTLIVKNGEIVTPSARFRGDIWCEGETIIRIGADLAPPPDAEVIDARGKLVFPGFIDPHVHIYLPFMGTFAKDTYETASRSALVGGTTTLIEMVCPARSDDPLQSYELWKSHAAGRSACDYAFHMGVTRWDDQTADVLRRVVADGTVVVQDFPGISRRVRHRRRRTVSHAGAGAKFGRDRHGALRERGIGGADAAPAAGGRKDRAGVA